MALIARLFVILFAFLAASFVAGAIVVLAVLYPEFSEFAPGPIRTGIEQQHFICAMPGGLRLEFTARA